MILNYHWNHLQKTRSQVTTKIMIWMIFEDKILAITILLKKQSRSLTENWSQVTTAISNWKLISLKRQTIEITYRKLISSLQLRSVTENWSRITAKSHDLDDLWGEDLAYNLSSKTILGQRSPPDCWKLISGHHQDHDHRDIWSQDLGHY